MQVLPTQTQELLRTGVNLTSFEYIIAELVENCTTHIYLISHLFIYLFIIYL